MDDESGYEAGSEASAMDDVSGNEAESEASPMDDNESGYEAGSEDPPASSSGSEISLAAVKPKPIKKKKEEPCEPCGPCEVCGIAINGHLMMTCIKCRDTREHIYCARAILHRVPEVWLCEECRKPPINADGSVPSFHVVEIPGPRPFRPLLSRQYTTEQSTPASSHPVSPSPQELKQPQGMDTSTGSKSED